MPGGLGQGRERLDLGREVQNRVGCSETRGRKERRRWGVDREHSVPRRVLVSSIRVPSEKTNCARDWLRMVAAVFFVLKLGAAPSLGCGVLLVTGSAGAGRGVCRRVACGWTHPRWCRAPRPCHAALPRDPCRPPGPLQPLCPPPPMLVGPSLCGCMLWTRRFRQLETRALSQAGIVGRWLWSGPCGIWWELLQTGRRVS